MPIFSARSALCACLAAALSLTAAPPARAAYGLLWLDLAPDDAEVFLDGRFLAEGVWLISLAPGRHTLSVRKSGYRPFHWRFLMPEGRSREFAVRLERMSGSPLPFPEAGPPGADAGAPPGGP